MKEIFFICPKDFLFSAPLLVRVTKKLLKHRHLGLERSDLSRKRNQMVGTAHMKSNRLMKLVTIILSKNCISSVVARFQS